MNGKLNFVPVRLTDTEELLALSKKIWLPTFAPLFTEEELASIYGDMYKRQKVEESILDPTYFMFFVDSDKRIGYGAIQKDGDVMMLDKIYIDPDLQGKGFGKKCLEWVEGQAREKNCEKIKLRVNRRNKGAIGFYEKLGFEIVETIDFDGPNGYIYDDYIMEKLLFYRS